MIETGTSEKLRNDREFVALITDVVDLAITQEGIRPKSIVVEGKNFIALQIRGNMHAPAGIDILVPEGAAEQTGDEALLIEEGLPKTMIYSLRDRPIVGKIQGIVDVYQEEDGNFSFDSYYKTYGKTDAAKVPDDEPFMTYEIVLENIYNSTV